MSKHTVTLEYPVTWEGSEVASLEFRRPKGGDVRRINSSSGDDLTKSFKLMADLAQVDPKLIDELDPADIAQINDWLEPILDPKARRAT